MVSIKSTTTPNKSGRVTSKATRTGKGYVDDSGQQVDIADVAKADLKAPGISRLLQYNRPEVPLLLLGVLMSIIVGAVFPAFAFILAELVRFEEQIGSSK